MPNKDPQNTSRADCLGAMTTAPKEVWRFGHVQHCPWYARRVTVGTELCYLIAENGRLEMVRQDGKALWHIVFTGNSEVLSAIDGPEAGRLLVRVGGDTLALLDIRSGEELWSWLAPHGTQFAFGSQLLKCCGFPDTLPSVRLVVFPCGVSDGDRGFCFQFDARSNRPKAVWERRYGDLYAQNFGPLVALADMDKDGRDEIVLAGKPATVAVIDFDTGEVKFHLRYPVEGDSTGQIGRPYGLLAVDDMDGDGYPDVVMVSCAVEKYLAVLHNVEGRRLELAWSKFIEQEFPENRHELVPRVTSLADINGDGRKELVIGLFNVDGDDRWHTIAFEGVDGFGARLLDLTDRFFWGCFDINGDGRDEVIVCQRHARNDESPSRVEAVDGASGKAVGAIEEAIVVPNSGADALFGFSRASWGRGVLPMAATTKNGHRGLVVRLKNQTSDQLWTVGREGSVLTTFATTILSRKILESQASGDPAPMDLSVPYGDSPGPAASSPLVADNGGRRELLVALSDGTITGGQVGLSRPGELRGRWTVAGTQPSVWQGPEGRRVVAAADPHREAMLLWTDLAEQKEPLRIDLPGGGYGPLPFDLDEKMGLFVPMQRQRHAQACAVYDHTGRRIWADMHHGPYPQQAGAADLNADGKTEFVVDDHGLQAIYDSAGSPRVFAQAWHDTVPGRSDGSAYALPIIGPFGPDGRLRIVMSPGLMSLEVLDERGARLAKRDFKPDPYAFEHSRSAVARRPGEAGWDLGMLDKAGRFHCVDLSTAQTRWSVDLGERIHSQVKIVAGDVNGDGADEFVLGLPDGSIYALGEADGAGRIVWKTQLDFGIRDLILADVDSDGKLELIVSTQEGLVRILR